MEIVSVINQKGGIGKTTTTLEMAEVLISKGYKVLLVDLDSQHHLTSFTNALEENVPLVIHENDDVVYGIYSVLKGICPVDPIQTIDKINIIASSVDIADADKQFTELGKEFILKKALAKYNEIYDYILLDTPPSLNILCINALAASTKVVIPMTADGGALEGLSQLFDIINAIKEYCNPTIKVEGILFLKHDKRLILCKEIKALVEKLSADLGTKVFNTTIRNCLALRESQAQHQLLMDYAPKCSAMLDYTDFVNEFLEGEK